MSNVNFDFLKASLENLSESEFQELIDSVPTDLPFVLPTPKPLQVDRPVLTPETVQSPKSSATDSPKGSPDQVDFVRSRKHKKPEIIALRDDTEDQSAEASDFSDQEHHSIVRFGPFST